VIGAELLNLMYGNPYNQFAGPQPTPNPNPNAPPPQRTGYMVPAPPQPQAPPMSPAPAPPGHFEILPDAAHSPHWVPGPATVNGRPLPGQITPATPAEQRGAQIGPPPGGPQMAPGAPPAPMAPNAPPPGQAALPPTVATQSPPDLASLYLQMEQRNRSANEIDRGLDMMAASMSTPSMASAIMGSRSQGQDPGAQLGNLIMLQNMQRMQSIPAPPGTEQFWNALPPDAKAKYIEAQGAANIDIAKQGAETKQKDLLEAQQKAPTAITQMQQMDQTATGLQNMKEADGTPVLQSLTQSGVTGAAKRNAADILIKAASDDKEHPGAFQNMWNSVQTSVLTPEEKAAVQQIIMLKGQIYGQEFINAGSRRTQTEINSLQSGVNPLANFNQPYDAYMKQFGDFQNRLHTGIVNTYGAAGRVDEIPDSLKWDMSDPKNPKPLVNSAYLPNGDLYAGHGGQWASNPPPKQETATANAPAAGKTYTYNPKTGQLE
jgi:hypothetical protein